MRYGSGLSVIILLIVLSCTGVQADKNIYGSISPEKYLSGQYDPENSGLFVSLADYGIPTDGRPQILRIETAKALKGMLADFKKAHPDIKIIVRSSFRSYSAQKSIWDRKWNGDTPVNGKRLNRSISDPKKMALEILSYSSMPGTSRHHWGTDFDINTLSNSYYEKGEGAVIYKWLSENAPSHGFCQPFNSGRTGGYLEEKWHWSYLPLSSLFLKDWNENYTGKIRPLMRGAKFSGMDNAIDLAPSYVNDINGRCR